MEYIDYETNVDPDWFMQARLNSLTKAQRRYLEEIEAAGVKTYNGRAGQVLRSLRSKNLIAFSFELIPQAGGRYGERYKAWRI